MKKELGVTEIRVFKKGGGRCSPPPHPAFVGLKLVFSYQSLPHKTAILMAPKCAGVRTFPKC